jgi:hypothetical protein
MTKEELYIDGQTIELIESLNPNLTFNIADIAKPDTRKADFSKTITIPGSKKINKIFEHIFDINTSLQTFNPNLKTDVVYLVDGEVQIDGYLQLKKVNNTDGLISYECVIIGRLGNFVNALGDKELDDASMNWSTLNHNWTQANQIASWSATTGYVYPMIDYATGVDLYDWGVTELFPAAFAKDYIDKMFAAAGYSYTSTFLTSDPFNKLIIPFNAKDFKFTTSEISTRTFSATTAQYQSTSSTSQNLNLNAGSSFNGALSHDTYSIKMTAESDPNNVYSTSLGKYTCNKKGTYNLQFEVDLTGTFTPQEYTTGASPSVDVRNITSIFGKLELVRRNSSGITVGGYTYTDTTGTVITTGILGSKEYLINYDTNTAIPTGTTSVTTSGATYPDSSYLEGYNDIEYTSFINTSSPTIKWYYDGYPRTESVQPNKYWVVVNNVELEANDTIETNLKTELYLEYYELSEYNGQISLGNVSVRPTPPLFVQSPNPFNTSGYFTGEIALNVSNGIFKNQVANNNYVEGDSIDFNTVIPKNIKQKDFFMSIIKMFNLYIQPDENNDKNLLIEPREDFYNNTIVDWSDKLDNSQVIEFLPMAAIDSKEYLYKYKDDKDYYNDLYTATWNESYGQRKKEINNEFLKNTNKTELIFSPTPLVGQLDQDRIIPSIKKYDENNGQARTESNIRILYYGGLKNCNSIWEHRGSLVSSTFNTTYPYAGHFDDPYTPTLDINFGLTKEIYYDDTFYPITLTDNNLFKKYYSKFIEEITDVNSKIVNAYFYLTPGDIKTLSFKKQYYFNGSYFRLNKIENYNPSNPVTKCEFLKIKLATVFQPTTAIINGGTGVLAGENTPLYQSGMIQHSNNNIINSESVRAFGSNNHIDASAKNVSIIGSNNYVTAGSENVTINGNNNLVSGAKNVSLINTDNTEVLNSNISYINNEIQGTGTIRTVNINARVLESVRTYLIDTSAANVTLTFPTTATYGKIWIFKKLHSSHQAIINAGTNLIDGAATYTMTSAYDTVELQWDGDTYNIISTK